MTTIPSVSAASLQAYAVRSFANAAKAAQASQIAAQPSSSPEAKVEHAMTRATYDASLDTLRSANKKMMGYLLNIEV